MKNPGKEDRGLVPQDMLEILVNGVFAFAMTLIVKNNIPFPSGERAADLQYLMEYVQNSLMDMISFGFTFVILTVFYILFFEIFRSIQRCDRLYVYLTFGMLLSIIFIPLTSLLWEISDLPVPYGILFHINILLSGSLLLLIWRYTSRRSSSLREGVSRRYIQNMDRRLLLFPLTAFTGLLIDGTDHLYGSVDITVLYLIPTVLFIILSRAGHGGIMNS